MSVNIDWLTLNVRISGKKIIPIYDQFEIVKTNKRTSIFETVEEVIYRKKRIATITRNPLSSIIDENTILIKFDNHTLYQKELFKYVCYILDSLQMTFHNFSRLDIAIDFNKLINYNKPEQLIKDFLNEKILICKKGKFTVIGEVDNTLEFQYIRFGTRTSGIVTYLYNKSLELAQKEMKPWIIDSAKTAGLDIEKEIWRLEFSITDFNNIFVNQDTGEVIKANNIEFLDKVREKDITDSLINKCFTFVKNDGQQRKDRMKKVNMFKDINKNNQLEKVSNKFKSDRSTKILIKNLDKLYNELRDNNRGMSNKSKTLQQFIINKTNLTNWYENKHLYWQ